MGFQFFSMGDWWAKNHPRPGVNHGKISGKLSSRVKCQEHGCSVTPRKGLSLAFPKLQRLFCWDPNPENCELSFPCWKSLCNYNRICFFCIIFCISKSSTSQRWADTLAGSMARGTSMPRLAPKGPALGAQFQFQSRGLTCPVGDQWGRHMVPWFFRSSWQSSSGNISDTYQ